MLRPARAVVLWWAFSLAIFLLLFPAEYKINLWRVIAVVVAASLAAYWGYTRSLRRASLRTAVVARATPNVWLVASSAVLMVFAGYAGAQAIGFTSDSIAQSTADLGAAYAQRKELQQSGTLGSTGTLVTSALFFLFPFAVPLAIMHGKALPLWLRVLVVAGVTFYGLYFLAGGTMKGFGDLTLLVILGLIARRSRAVVVEGSSAVLKHRRRWFLATAATVIAFLLLVASAMASRLDGRPATLPVFRRDGALGQLLGPHWSVGVEAMLAYFAKGYMGLGISLDYAVPYDVYGGFRGISDLLSRYLGFEDAYSHSLPFIAEGNTGYSATANWWTVFPWLASDFGWIGAVLFIGLVGALAGRLWVEIVYRQDALAVGLFYFVLTFLVFVPANNQVFIGSGSTVGSLVLLFLYLGRNLLRAANTPGGSARSQPGQGSRPVRKPTTRPMSMAGARASGTGK